MPDDSERPEFENPYLDLLSKLLENNPGVIIAVMGLVALIAFGFVAVTTLSVMSVPGSISDPGNENATQNLSVDDSTNFTFYQSTVVQTGPGTVTIDGESHDRLIEASYAHVPSKTDSDPGAFGLQNTSANRSCIAKWTDEAEAATSTFVERNEGSVAVLEYTSKNGSWFVISSVRPDGETLAEVLVSSGYATVSYEGFPGNSSHPELGELQKQAQEDNRGVWSCDGD